MTKLVIIGAGLGGLAAALFCARRGHSVTLIERDPNSPPQDADECFLGWPRQSIGHARQTHVFMPLSNRILAEEAPDVLEALIAAGVRISAAPFLGRDNSPPILGARRLVYEGVVRRIVAAEPGVTLHCGISVTGLKSKSGNPPVITGVYTSDGNEIAADLIVDAAGRGSQVNRWLESSGTRPPREAAQKTGFSYLTRWYRLREGEEYPEFAGPPGAQCGFATFLIGQADNRCFSLMIGLSDSDPFRHAPRSEALFDRIVAAVPHTSAWVARGEPILPPQPYGNVGNYRRWLVDGEGPIVGGLVSIGDSSVRTNSTLGRGVSLAYLHAQHLAVTAERAGNEPISFVTEFERWTQDYLGTWFDTQVEIDGHYAAKLEAFHAGEAPPEAPLTARAFNALSICALRDPEIADLFGSMVGLLTTFEAVMATPGVAERIAPFLANNGQFFPPVQFERREFEQLVLA